MNINTRNTRIGETMNRDLLEKLKDHFSDAALWHDENETSRMRQLVMEELAKSEQEPLTDTYVQKVPDKCDRIVWRDNYYNLAEQGIKKKRLNEQEREKVYMEAERSFRKSKLGYRGQQITESDSFDFWLLVCTENAHDITD
jgi:hypothetical protein